MRQETRSRRTFVTIECLPKTKPFMAIFLLVIVDSLDEGLERTVKLLGEGIRSPLKGSVDTNIAEDTNFSDVATVIEQVHARYSNGPGSR